MPDSPANRGLVLVVGATGKLGGVAIKLLLAEGFAVRGLVRDPKSAKGVVAREVELCTGDLTDPDSLRRACHGVDFVIAAAHAALGKGANDPESVDGQGHKDLIDAAREAGVRHFTYVSVAGIGENHPVDLFRIKFATERYLVKSGLGYAIIAGPGFMETQHDLMGGLILRRRTAVIFGGGRMKSNFVSVVDMARYAVWSLVDPRLRNRRTLVGGPENLTQREIVAIYEDVCGVSVKRVFLPVPLLRLLTYVLGSFQPVIRRVLTMGIISATEDLSLATDDLHAEFARQPLTYKETTRRWFDRACTT
jgi:uncharacterized protein YbjT (DUF2867 family)